MQPVLFCIHLNGMGMSSPQHISLAQLIDFHTNANNTHASNRRQKLVGYMYRLPVSNASDMQFGRPT